MAEAFHWPVRVYYEDTDAGGVVFYANYLKYFERARTEWLRAAGLSQRALAAAERLLFVVKAVAVDYHAPARLDDGLLVSVEVEKAGRASIDFVQRAWRVDGEVRKLLCSARVCVVCVDGGTMRPTALPDGVRALLPCNRAKPT